MDASTPGLFCALLLYSLLFFAICHSQKCVPQPIPDMVIDINQAVAFGARFTDPLSVPSEEECLSACCMQRDKGGDQDCNLLVFDARKGPGLQNCYIFHCPTENACPLTTRVGVLSYSFWSETSSPGKQATKSGNRSKTLGGAADNKKPSAVIASQGSAKHSAKDEASKIIASQLLHLADKMDQRLEKMESESESDLQVHYPSPTTAIAPAVRTTPTHKEGKKVPSPDAKVAKPGKVTYKKPNPTGTAPVRTSPRIGTPTPHPAGSQDVSAKKVPVKNAKPPGKSRGAMATTPHTEGPALATVRQTRAPQMVTRPAPVRTSPSKGTNKSSTSDKDETPDTHPPSRERPAVNLEEVPRKVEEGAGSGGALSLLEDRSGLVAALAFGVMFLLVVIGLVSRKVTEARRRHRYTKLDYLINGMYVDT